MRTSTEVGPGNEEMSLAGKKFIQDVIPNLRPAHPQGGKKVGNRDPKRIFVLHFHRSYIYAASHLPLEFTVRLEPKVNLLCFEWKYIIVVK